MKTAIIFMSKHGTTEKIANWIKSRLDNQEVVLYNLQNRKPENLDEFEQIIIGGSVHIGSIQNKLKKYITKNLNFLLDKKLAIFLVCMDKTEERNKFLEKAFPAALREKACATVFPGGEFCFEKMNFLEKKMIEKIAGTSQNLSNIDYEALEKFVDKLV